MFWYDPPKKSKAKKTILCQCWHCGKNVRVPNTYPIPAESEIFCAACRRICGIAPRPTKK